MSFTYKNKNGFSQKEAGRFEPNHGGGISDSGTARFPVNDHTEQRVRKLTRAARRPTVPPPTRSHPGDLVGKYGVQASATDLEATPFCPNPHRSILPWARYRRIDPLGLGQNARWTDLLLATGLTGQLRKGQFSSHRSADRCTLNSQPVTPVTGYR